MVSFLDSPNSQPQMDINASEIQSLIDRPSESLTVELKRWIDPNSAEGQAKIAKAAIALRNFNGGYLVIGFDDKTLEPDVVNTPSNVRAIFHIDTSNSRPFCV
jgi:predicted HTH transcriptional regulator